MILLTIPIFFPMIMGLDFGMPKESVAIWFGIMVLMTVGFGMLAPPVGLNVYVVNGMAKDVPIAESYRGVMPFLAQRHDPHDHPAALPVDLALAVAVHPLGEAACGYCARLAVRACVLRPTLAVDDRGAQRASSSTPWWTLPLVGNREWVLRPHARTASPVTASKAQTAARSSRHLTTSLQGGGGVRARRTHSR